jgi:cation diffusion facilitator family transporter
VAAERRPAVLTPARYREVSRVLGRVLVLNLIVALAKIVYGFYAGAISVVSDGFHSLTDTASNVTGLLAMRVAQRPPDSTHPYGHRKFETLASGAIFVFLAIVLVQVVRTALDHLATGETPHISVTTFSVMGLTLAVNLLVVWYERRAGARLKSELLRADAAHTMSDVYTSLAVIGALIGVRLGFPLLDPLAALVVAVFIGQAGYRIAREASDVLADSAVMDPTEIERVVLAVPDVRGCHEIRTRGTADHVFLDLHVWFPGHLRLDDAHGRSHVVKDAVMAAFPAIKDVVIHIEPADDGPRDA